MAAHLFKTKSIEQLVGDVEHGGEARSSAVCRPVDLYAAGHRGHYRHRHLRADRHRGGQPGRPGHRARRTSSAGLACAFAALCYAEFASMIPDRRQRLHLRVCDAGRALRLDHRLGPDSRYAVGVDDGRDRLERLHAAAARRCFGIDLPVWAQAAIGSAPAARHQPAGGAHRAPDHDRCWSSACAESARANASWSPQGRRRAVLHRRRAHASSNPDELDAVLRRTGGSGRSWRAAAVVFFAYIGFDAVSTTARGSQEPATRLADRHHRVAGRSARSSTWPSRPCSRASFP